LRRLAELAEDRDPRDARGHEEIGHPVDGCLVDAAVGMERRGRDDVHAPRFGVGIHGANPILFDGVGFVRQIWSPGPETIPPWASTSTSTTTSGYAATASLIRSMTPTASARSSPSCANTSLAR